MTLLVLISTGSYTVDKHFCGKVLVDSSILSKAKTCGIKIHSESSSDHSSMEDGMCCSNEKIAVEGQDELKVPFESFNFDQQIFITSFTYTYLNLFKGRTIHLVPFKNYSPPLLVSDIQVLDQVFLI